jgi:hypothetical protein
VSDAGASASTSFGGRVATGAGILQDALGFFPARKPQRPMNISKEDVVKTLRLARLEVPDWNFRTSSANSAPS